MDSKRDDGDVMERGEVEQSPTANHSLRAASTFSTLLGSVKSFLSFTGYNKEAQKASDQNLCHTVNNFVRSRSINRKVKVRKCKESSLQRLPLLSIQYILAQKAIQDSRRFLTAMKTSWFTVGLATSNPACCWRSKMR